MSDCSVLASAAHIMSDCSKTLFEHLRLTGFPVLAVLDFSLSSLEIAIEGWHWSPTYCSFSPRHWVWNKIQYGAKFRLLNLVFKFSYDLDSASVQLMPILACPHHPLEHTLHSSYLTFWNKPHDSVPLHISLPSASFETYGWWPTFFTVKFRHKNLLEGQFNSSRKGHKEMFRYIFQEQSLFLISHFYHYLSSKKNMALCFTSTSHLCLITLVMLYT